MSYLKPCPFCNSEDVEQDPGSDFAMCNSCKSCARVELWNSHKGKRFYLKLALNAIQSANIIDEEEAIESLLQAFNNE